MWKTMSSNDTPRSVLSFSFFSASQMKYFTDQDHYNVCLLETGILPLLHRGRDSVG